MTTDINNLLFGGVCTKGDFGVEIEVEGVQFPENFTDTIWRAEFDGSLRGPSREFVMKKPVSISDIPRHLERLKKKIVDSGVKSSDRTGTHIHINISELTSTQVMSFVTAYYIMEELIVSTCGPNRQGNHFCFRAVDAENITQSLSEAIRTKRFGNVMRDEYRYTALNLLPIYKYGSLEFRALQTTPDFSNILPMCHILYSLREYATQVRDPIEVVEQFSGGDIRGFMKHVLGKKSFEYVFERSCIHPQMWNDVAQNGVWVAQEVAYSLKDWSEFSVKNKYQKDLFPVARTIPLRVQGARMNDFEDVNEINEEF